MRSPTFPRTLEAIGAPRIDRPSFPSNAAGMGPEIRDRAMDQRSSAFPARETQGYPAEIETVRELSDSLLSATAQCVSAYPRMVSAVPRRTRGPT